MYVLVCWLCYYYLFQYAAYVFFILVYLAKLNENKLNVSNLNSNYKLYLNFRFRNCFGTGSKNDLDHYTS